ncbi:hypothetical protein IJT17_03175 [bacterium]|nr:hypothetical protein [bacterium]
MSIDSVNSSVSYNTQNTAERTQASNESSSNSAVNENVASNEEAASESSAASEPNDDVSLSDSAAEIVESENAADEEVCGEENIGYSSGEITSLDDMKNQMAYELGINPSDVIVVSGSRNGDEISVTSGGDDGSVVVNVNGTETTYTAEEAKRLLIDGGAGDDNIVIDEDIATGMHIFGGKGDDNIYGGSGNDFIVDDYGYNNIYGRGGDDTIRAAGDDFLGFGINNIFGGAGNDTIYGGDVVDYIYGGEGDDKIYGGGAGDYINGGNGNDTIEGGSGADTLRGDGGNDYISGGSGKDTIYGGAGDDLIYGNEGKDTIDGGAGSDVIAGKEDEWGGSDKITTDEHDRVVTESTDVQMLRETMTDVKDEDIQLAFGTDGDDEINITSGGSDGSIIVSVNGEEKRYTAAEARSLIIDGGRGNDNITVSEDVRANLHITGGAGDDRIQGGSGKDTIYDNYGSNNIDGGAGNDVLMAHGLDSDGFSTKSNTIVGGSGNDYIEGGDGNDYLSGGDGYDVLYGLGGNDTMFGGDGHDYLDGGKGDDRIYGGLGDDNLVGGQGNDSLYGGSGDDLLVGASGSDYVEGGAGADKAIADSADNVRTDDDDVETEHREVVEVPDNFAAEGTYFERERIESDFEFLASTENGQRMFSEIAATGHNVTVGATNEGSVCYSYGGRSNPGVGSDSTIGYNLTKISLNNGTAWADRAPVISMYHEMCHSYNAAIGNMDFGFYDAAGNSTDSAHGTKGCEYQAMGVENPSVDNNDHLLSENGLRELLGFNERLRY